MWLSRKNQINNNSQTSPSRKSPSSKSNSPSRKSPSSNFNRHCCKNIEDFLGDDDKNVSPKKDQKQPPQKQKQKQKQPSGSSPVSAKQRQSLFVFNRVSLANQFTCSIASTRPRQKPVVNGKPTRKSETLIKIPDKRIVVYMTSLGAVRPTFDACRAVRSILQGFRVMVEERDLSMETSFKDELHKIMLQTGRENKAGGLPRVFIGGRYVGDADDLRQMNETGELQKLIEGLPAVSRSVCECCGDFRFIICQNCFGSRKCYKQKGGLRICMMCNKNGLIRCPICCTIS